MSDRQFNISKRSRSRRDEKIDFYKVALAGVDVRTAIYTCDAFLKLIHQWSDGGIPFEVSDAFIGTIVLCYSRPFVDNKFPGVLPRRWAKFSTRELQAGHDDMLEQRHSLFAHTDADVHQLSVVPSGCLPISIGPKPPQVAYKINALKIPPHNVVRYRATCLDLQPRLEAESQRLLHKLYDGLDLPKREFLMRFDDGL